jgi:4-methyl-5(b-hydroxyethyl)-thiazole monophosphate biosynthesis
MKLAVFFANGFEEVEALTVVDICRRADYTVTMVSVEEQEEVIGSHGIAVKTDQKIHDLDVQTLDMLVLPGGKVGVERLKNCDLLMEQLEEFNRQKKWIGAICAAPSILGERGILQGVKACSHPDFEEKLAGAQVSRQDAVIDGHIITSRGMGTSIAFALSIVTCFSGEAAAEKLAKAIVFQQ